MVNGINTDGLVKGHLACDYRTLGYSRARLAMSAYRWAREQLGVFQLEFNGSKAH